MEISGQTHAQTLIRLSDIHMRHSDRLIFDGVNLDIRSGDFLTITGPNGGGKTTLLRILLKLIHPTSGRVDYYNPDHSLTTALRIGYLPQKSAIDARFPITVSQIIESGLGGHLAPGLTNGMRRKAIDNMIDRVDLRSYAGQPIGTLSGGQLQRALIGRALISRPDIAVLDEPLSYLDRHFGKVLHEMLSEISHETTVILVSHEMTELAEISTRHIIVDHGITECRSHHHAVHYDCDSE